MKSHPRLDEQRHYYDQTWNQVAQSSYQQQHLKNRIFAIVHILSNLDLDQPRIFEIGCGLGQISSELASIGTVTAMDLSPNAISIAQSRFPDIRFIAGDFLNHSLPNGCFDVVVSSEVIEHIPLSQRNAFVDMMADLVAPGGYVILTTPNGALSIELEKDQPVEEHFLEDELRQLLSHHFDIQLLTTIHRVFPIGANRSRVLQALRAGSYELLNLRGVLENPFRASDRGLYFVVLAQKRQ